MVQRIPIRVFLWLICQEALLAERCGRNTFSACQVLGLKLPWEQPLCNGLMSLHEFITFSRVASFHDNQAPS